ncbi:hypothetical protein L6164_017320 [Bauhinia variegata]|uniref:Uncharacterized protein n=1 Tax=Bauhinia variegata TaxID=167791 RepID=A0ACB9N7J3_BAUVA|nr:hypothetical protein L6164_017320 [Bauhinia variegata]
MLSGTAPERIFFSCCHGLISTYGDQLMSALRPVGFVRGPKMIVIPGSEIPEWFGHKSSESSLSFQVPVGTSTDIKALVLGIRASRLTWLHIQVFINGERVSINGERFYGQNLVYVVESDNLFLDYMPQIFLPSSREDCIDFEVKSQPRRRFISKSESKSSQENGPESVGTLQAENKKLPRLLRSIRLGRGLTFLQDPIESIGWDQLGSSSSYKSKWSYDVFLSFRVRHQKGCFAEAFAKHEDVKRHSEERIQRWRTALNKAASLSGWHLGDELSKTVYIRVFVETSDTLFHLNQKLCRITPFEFEVFINGKHAPMNSGFIENLDKEESDNLLLVYIPFIFLPSSREYYIDLAVKVVPRNPALDETLGLKALGVYIMEG